MSPVLVTVICVGVVVLIGLAVAVGAALDTSAQRTQWQEVARQRRALAEERRWADGPCADCPLRRREGPPGPPSG